MRCIILVVGILTLGAGVARADDEDVDEGDVDGDEGDIDAIAPAPAPSHEWWADARITGGTVLGAASPPVGELALAAHGQRDGGFAQGMLLSSLRADAQARAGVGGQNPGLSLSADLSSRVLAFRFADKKGVVYELVPVDVYAQLAQDLVPQLSTRRSFWRRPYARELVGVQLSFGNLLDDKWEVLRFYMEAGRLSQTDETEIVRHREAAAGFTMASYGYARPDPYQPDVRVDLLSVDGRGVVVENGPDAVVVKADLVRASGMRLGPLYADLAGGPAGTGTMNISVESGGDSWSTTITTENLPNIATMTGRARLYTVGERAAFALEAERSMYLTVDVELALESRATLSARWRNPYGELQVRGFLSDNQLWLDKETSEHSRTWGGFASWHHQLTEDISAVASVEVARSFYVNLTDGSLRPTPEVGTQVLVTLVKHFGKPWRARSL